MESREITALMKSVGVVVRDYVAKITAGWAERIENLEKSVKEIPAGPKGEDGKDGLDANLEVIQLWVNTEVSKAVAALPVPKDGDPGKDGESIPGPKGDKGEPGKDADPVDIESIIGQVVDRIPKPKDGKDADIDEIRSLIASEVAKIPVPKDGKDAEPVDVERLIGDVVDRIPVPKDGKDVKPEEIRPIVAEEVSKAVSGLPVPKDGLPGKDGKDAEPIHPDTISLMVMQAVEKAVAAIPRAKDGDNGRDAIEVEVLPEINPAKSYPPRTYAAHAGGTVMSKRRTTAGDSVDMSEWLVVLNGIASEEKEQADDHGGLVVRTTFTNGAVVTKNLRYPVVTYRKVFQKDEQYFKGNTVSHNSSMWHCNVDGTKAIPGMPPYDDWTLCVKAVRGKDGLNGKDGQPGPEGKPGRDLTQMSSSGMKH